MRKMTGCACSRVIKNAKQQLMNSRYGEDALSMQLAMVGNDMGARKFLEGESPSESCEKFRRETIEADLTLCLTLPFLSFFDAEVDKDPIVGGLVDTTGNYENVSLTIFYFLSNFPLS